MGWLEEYEKKLDDKLRQRIARDFPLLEASQVEQLALYLTADVCKKTKAMWSWLLDQLGSTVAVQKFLDLYWPSRAESYRSYVERNRRAGTRARRRNRR